MGAYLSHPVTDKETTVGSCQWHKWACSSMQGWRSNMEDAHTTISSLGCEGGMSICHSAALFGVFDGHGGSEVAAFCSKNLPGEISRQLAAVSESNTDGLPSVAVAGEVLKKSFNRMDELLREPQHQQELLVLKQRKPASSDAHDTQDETSGNSQLSRGAPIVMLQASIQRELSQAREKGSLTKEEAKQLMTKMTILRRLETNERTDAASPSTAADHVGCTSVCVLLTETDVVCANAGDSRAVLCRKGQAVELSHDHKPNSEVERRRIEAAGGTVEESTAGTRVQYRVNGNLNLSRAIGDLDFKRREDLDHDSQVICSTPDLVNMSITEDDEFIVLACDGIWDVKSNQEVCDFVRDRLSAGEDLPHIIEALLNDCIADDPKATCGIGGDNMTCMVVKFLRS
eukprot:TRINITY_DN74276_c0_g1_i1.p1 TRINITY_DN74276_c0_g1~~TRINITY_DN74276_c0_g1_i1.p1  ORF type:complete len:401 (-),score=83.76 TRINITY_DN74276_c0_g1_i1:35-1237(-)